MISLPENHRQEPDGEEKDELIESLLDEVERITGLRGPMMENAGKEPPLPQGFEEMCRKMFRKELSLDVASKLRRLLLQYPSWSRANADIAADEFRRSQEK
jgi:hypothetical protein